jgi:hypothetical protein
MFPLPWGGRSADAAYGTLSIRSGDVRLSNRNTRQQRSHASLEWKLEVVTMPVSDLGRAKDFYDEKLGFNVDIDHVISDDVRFLQLTPYGSACSIHLRK